LAKNLSSSGGATEAPAAPSGARAMRPLKIAGGALGPAAAYNDALPADQHAGIVLIYKPGRYEVFGDRVLPALVEHPLENGVGGVSQRRDGTYNISGLRDNEEQNGAFLLPQEWGYVGQGDGPPNRFGVVPCETAWRTPAEYHALVASWVDAGRLPKPTALDLERLLERKQRDADGIRSHQKNPDTATYGLAEVERQIGVVQAALAEAA
jgi:hypothetical protein